MSRRCVSAFGSRSFGVDFRSLALLRVSLGWLLLVDLLIRFQSLEAHYTDQGIFPRTSRITVYESGPPAAAHFWWSFHMMNGQWWFQALLFGAAAMAAACLLIGFRTRLATLVSWALLLSLHARAPEILNAGDSLLLLLLFWSCFLPLGARASVDALRTPKSSQGKQSQEYCSIASIALMLQIALVYVVNALVKTGPEWNHDFTAAYYALNMDLYVTAWGKQLLDYPALLGWLTATTYYWELLGPFVALSPVANGWCRGFAVVGFICFHLALAACLELGLFPFVAIAAWLVFLPAQFWDGCSQAVSPKRLRLLAVSTFLSKPLQSLSRYAGTVSLNLCIGSRIFIAVALVYVTALNVRHVLQMREQADASVAGGFSAWEIPESLLRLDQRWSMFAPSPATDDGWFVMRGTLANGEQVNLWQPGSPVSFDQPNDVSDLFPDHRWRKYFANVRSEYDEDLARTLSDWLRRHWANSTDRDEAEGEVALVEVYFQSEPTPPPDQDPAAPTTWLLWTIDYSVTEQSQSVRTSTAQPTISPPRNHQLPAPPAVP